MFVVGAKILQISVVSVLESLNNIEANICRVTSTFSPATSIWGMDNN